MSGGLICPAKLLNLTTAKTAHLVASCKDYSMDGQPTLVSDAKHLLKPGTKVGAASAPSSFFFRLAL
eukprot:5653293-Amphidinium_carterae.1